jgi:CheY-like chemotaxis protein
MIIYSNKTQGTDYPHCSSVAITSSQSIRMEIGSSSIFTAESRTAEKKAENTVLVTSDMPDPVGLIIVLLCKFGCSVLIACDEREGFEVAQDEHPRLVISNVAMPRIDGIAMCRLIHEDPELRALSVLLFGHRSQRQQKRGGRLKGRGRRLSGSALRPHVLDCQSSLTCRA